MVTLKYLVRFSDAKLFFSAFFPFACRPCFLLLPSTLKLATKGERIRRRRTRRRRRRRKKGISKSHANPCSQIPIPNPDLCSRIPKFVAVGRGFVAVIFFSSAGSSPPPPSRPFLLLPLLLPSPSSSSPAAVAAAAAVMPSL